MLDPSRIVAQVISGIGFLGAGTIMFLRRTNVVRGLTTAAGLWTVAAIGLAVGGGMYAAPVITTAIALVILAALKPLERRFALRKTWLRVTVGFEGRPSLAAIEQVLAGRGLMASSIASNQDSDDGAEVVMEFMHGFDRGKLGELADALHDVPGVRSVSLDVAPPGGEAACCARHTHLLPCLAGKRRPAGWQPWTSHRKPDTAAAQAGLTPREVALKRVLTGVADSQT